jgi:hypothetical protein
MPFGVAAVFAVGGGFGTMAGPGFFVPVLGVGGNGFEGSLIT